STALSKDVIEEMQKYASNKQRLTTPNVYRQEAALYKRQAALIRPKNPADSLSQAVGEVVGGVQEQLPQLLKELNTHPIVGELRQKAGGSFDITESLIINICQMMEARLDREGARLAYSTLAELIRDRLAAAR